MSVLKSKALWTVVFIAIMTAVFISRLPEPIDIDLSKIGNGKKSVVFIYDLNRVVSNQQTIQMNEARESLGDSINFLVAKTGYPPTDELMQRHDADITELLFFDTKGQLIERKFALLDANALIEILSKE